MRCRWLTGEQSPSPILRLWGLRFSQNSYFYIFLWRTHSASLTDYDPSYGKQSHPEDCHFMQPLSLPHAILGLLFHSVCRPIIAMVTRAMDAATALQPMPPANVATRPLLLGPRNTCKIREQKTMDKLGRCYIEAHDGATNMADGGTSAPATGGHVWAGTLASTAPGQTSWNVIWDLLAILLGEWCSLNTQQNL